MERPGKLSDGVRLTPGQGWTFEVVGESHYQGTLERVYRNQGGKGHSLEVSAQLMPEPDNQYDPNAIRVTLEGDTVAYLTREKAAEYHDAIGLQSGVCSGKIVGGFMLENDVRANYGIKLNLKWPPEAF
jgi:hypothetical protein